MKINFVLYKIIIGQTIVNVLLNLTNDKYLKQNLNKNKNQKGI